MNKKEERLAKRKIKRERTRRWMRELKSVPCADCKRSFDPVCMDFDHKNPRNKEFEIGRNANEMNFERLKQEIAKCDVVCANCHRIRSKNRLGWA